MWRAKAEQKKIKNYLGRVYRNILRNCLQPDKELAELLQLTQRLLNQKRHNKNKLYSLHAPEMECKGKAHEKNEFGCKVSVATTSRDNWIIGVEALHDNPFDAILSKERCIRSSDLSAGKLKMHTATRATWAIRNSLEIR